MNSRARVARRPTALVVAVALCGAAACGSGTQLDADAPPTAVVSVPAPPPSVTPVEVDDTGGELPTPTPAFQLAPLPTATPVPTPAFQLAPLPTATPAPVVSAAGVGPVRRTPRDVVLPDGVVLNGVDVGVPSPVPRGPLPTNPLYWGVNATYGWDDLVTTPAVAPPPVPAPGVAPLTSLAAGGPLERPAIMAKVDNSGPARPQTGLGAADLVFEEMVEWNLTRFAAVFHSTGAPIVGPVRSGRSSDVGMVNSLNRPLLVWSGANGVFLDILRAQNLVDRSGSGYWRGSGRAAPWNLYTSTDAHWAVAGSAPVPHFVYRSPGEPLSSSARPVRAVHVDFGPGGNQVLYRWDAALGAWRRSQNGTPHVETDGVQLAPQNVIVQVVDYIDSGLRDSAGGVAYEAVMLGSGPALVFVDGHVVQARWAKPSLSAVTTFTDTDGNHIALDPGRTWIALVPPGATSYG